MNVKRFTARTSRDALSLVRQALGDDAVVLSTKPSAHGVEVLAMAPESLQQVERYAAAPASQATPPAVAAAAPSTKLAARAAAQHDAASEPTPVEEDAQRLTMSTLSFQDYVRDRLLKRRQAALNAERRSETPVERPEAAAPAPRAVRPSASTVTGDETRELRSGASAFGRRSVAPAGETPLLHDPALLHASEIHVPGVVAAAAGRSDHDAMLNELRSMKGLIEERFGALAFMEKLQRQPTQARLTQKLLDCGFSPALIRKLADGLTPDITDETGWAAGVLERNLHAGDAEAALEDLGGVYALVGATGVGKTTTTAKIAAAFAAKYGASNLGLITLDAYRIGAHEQLRAYGRILGAPVHTAHDRASLEDLLELLTAKKMVLIDTAGMAQRDTRTVELLEMISHRAIRKLLVVNAAAQGETIEDVLGAYRAPQCAGIVLSKMDEAVKLGPALDALIRWRLKVIGVANGQRVPEDWHRLSAHALVHRALRGGGSAAYRFDAGDVNLIFTASSAAHAPSDAARN